MAVVTITIRPDGKTTVESSGYQGPTCATITDPYKQALGKEVKEVLKPEFFQAEEIHAQETN